MEKNRSSSEISPLFRALYHYCDDEIPPLPLSNFAQQLWKEGGKNDMVELDCGSENGLEVIFPNFRSNNGVTEL